MQRDGSLVFMNKAQGRGDAGAREKGLVDKVVEEIDLKLELQD